MPLFEYACNAQHVHEHYHASASAAPPTRPCRTCGDEAGKMVSRFNPLQYFSESNGRRIANLDPTRVLHSHGQHAALMREKGVEPATQWFSSSMKQTDGLTTKSKPGVKTLY